MKKKETRTEDLMYLAERAAIFLTFLDSSGNPSVFPMRKEAWADLDKRVQSGSKAQLKNLNNLIDNILIGGGQWFLVKRHKPFLGVIKIQKKESGEKTVLSVSL
jgi:hypothetical protein